MGIFFKSTCPMCWETEEYCKCTKEDREKYEYEKNNHVYKQLKKAIFRGIDLVEGDMITNDYREGNQYIIRDFLENGTPIVDKLSCEKYDFYSKAYPHEEIFVIRNNLNEC